MLNCFVGLQPKLSVNPIAWFPLITAVLKSSLYNRFNINAPVAARQLASLQRVIAAQAQGAGERCLGLKQLPLQSAAGSGQLT